MARDRPRCRRVARWIRLAPSRSPRGFVRSLDSASYYERRKTVAPRGVGALASALTRWLLIRRIAAATSAHQADENGSATNVAVCRALLAVLCGLGICADLDAGI